MLGAKIRFLSIADQRRCQIVQWQEGSDDEAAEA